MTTQQQTPAERLAHLQKLESMGMLDGVTKNANGMTQKEELADLVSKGVGSSAPDADGWETRDVNTDAFKRGWSGGAMPPPQDGKFLAVCTGTSVPTNNPNDLLVNFVSKPGTKPEFNGSYYIDEVNNPSDEGSRAGKFKDALDALGVEYRIVNGKLQHKPLKGKECYTIWATIDVKKGTSSSKQRRIQDLKNLKDTSEQAV